MRCWTISRKTVKNGTRSSAHSSGRLSTIGGILVTHLSWGSGHDNVPNHCTPPDEGCLFRPLPDHGRHPRSPARLAISVPQMHLRAAKHSHITRHRAGFLLSTKEKRNERRQLSRARRVRRDSVRIDRRWIGLCFANVVVRMNITIYLQTFCRYAMSGYRMKHCHRFAWRRATA